MAKGIVVKVWNVTAGSEKRSASSQIADSIAYIENPEKTGVPLDITNVNQLSNELTYVTNEIKTASGLYVGGRHITDISHAMEEMMQIKEFFGKLDGRVATHGVISLDESESDPKNAGKLMELLNDVMEEVFPNYQVVYAVHTNTENLHIHFILNTVGLDGKKIHMDKQFMSGVLEPAVNKAAIKYGFTPNPVWEKEKKEDPLSLPQRKIMLRQAIDIAIEQTDEFDSFVAFLRNQGFVVNVGKNLSLQTDDMPKAMRSGQLGEEYRISAIRKRLDAKYDPFKEVKAGDYYTSILPEEMANITPLKMKNYKDMSKEEKYEAVRLLRLGRNPWNEARNTNWQMANMADELKNVNYVYKLVNHYSKGSLKVSDAMNAIIESRKAIAEEKKQLRALVKEYKPITNIYQEMKQYMVRAYLFDAYGYSEYLSDYKKFHPGGFTTGDKSGDIEMLQWLCARGYVAAGINYTLRDEAHPEASVYSQSMEIKDAVPVVVAEAERRGYHIDVMAMAGGSAGHCLAMLYAYRDADDAPVPVKMVFGGVGPSCFYPEDWGCYGLDQGTPEALEAAAGLFGIMAGKEITPDMFGTPAYDEAMKDISAMLWVDDNTVPSLLAYGAYDKVQGFGASVKLDAALTAYNVPHDYIVFEHSGHGLQNDSKMAKLYSEKIEEYLNTYMPVK